MQTSRALCLLATLFLAVSTGHARRHLTQAPAPGPACQDTVAETARAAGLTTLLQAAQAAGLTSTLSDPNLAYTVFAPTNEAFSEAANDLNVTASQLLSSPDLGSILENHLLAYPLPSADLLSYGSVTTQYNNAPLNITSSLVGNETIVEVSTPVTSANVIMADIRACRSIVHVIDQVLIPDLNGVSSA